MLSLWRRRGRRARAAVVRTRTLVSITTGAVLLQLGWAAPASAQADAGHQVLLGDSYAEVLRANPRIAVARALAQAADARVAGASRPPDPQLQFGFMNYSLPSLAPMPTVGMAQLQLMQMLPLGGKLALAGRVAGAQASATAVRAEDVRWSLRAETAMAFYDLYVADQGLGVARETLRILQDIEKTTQSMYRVGEGRQTDVLRAQVEIAKMAEDTIRMHAMRETMASAMNALLDRDAAADVGEPALPEFPATVPEKSWFDSIAVSERPMVRAGVDDVRAAEVSEQLARKEIWPDLQIGVQYAQRGGDMGTERMGSLMFGASIPIFARARQFAMRDEAAAMKQMALADVAATRAETRGKIGEAYANLARARSLAQLYRSTVLPQAEATAASAQASYRVGNIDFITLLDDRMAVKKYRQELFALDADQGKAWVELEMLTGRELFDPNRVSTATATSGGGI